MYCLEMGSVEARGRQNNITHLAKAGTGHIRCIESGKHSTLISIAVLRLGIDEE